MLYRAAMRFLLVAAVLGGCASTAADLPLTIPLGLDRDATTKALADHQYCHKVDPPQKHEHYPRCDRIGTDWGQSWVTAEFGDDNKAVELRRWERFDDDAKATERWHQLVVAREEQTPASEAALEALRKQGLLQPGIRAVKAFQTAPNTVVAVYLLTPSPPENAAVLESVTLIH